MKKYTWLIVLALVVLATTARADWRLSAGIGGAEDIADFYIGGLNTGASTPYEVGGWLMWQGAKPNLNRDREEFVGGVYCKLFTGTITVDNPIPWLKDVLPIVELGPYGELRLSLVDEIDVAPALGATINEIVWIRGSYVNEILKGTDIQTDNDSEYVIGVGMTFGF